MTFAPSGLDAIVAALLRLHEYLQVHPAPIDYQRRRTLNYDDLLPEAQWTDWSPTKACALP